LGHFGKYDKYNATTKATTTRIIIRIYEFSGCSNGDAKTIGLSNKIANNMSPRSAPFYYLAKKVPTSNEVGLLVLMKLPRSPPRRGCTYLQITTHSYPNQA
jgi:hypothetical protein